MAHNGVVTRRRFGARAELGRFFGLLGATAVAISQPLLDIFGKSPETFIFRSANGRDLVVFGLMVVLVPPALLWLAGVTVGFVTPRWRAAAHAVCVGALFALLVVQVVAPSADVAVMALAATTTCGVTLLVARFAPVRLWVQLLAVLPLVSLIVFVTSSPASDAVGDGELDVVDATTGQAVAPIVLIIVDELPTSSILDATGVIDRVRFPNLARFGGDATWYRNSTTLSGYTRSAVPSLLTGKVPDNSSPLFTSHPNSLFRLAAGTHHLVVEEAITQLCPRSACGEGPQAPDGRRDDGPGADLVALYAEAVDIWFDRIAGRRSTTDLLDEFEESVNSTSGASPVPFASDESPTELSSGDVEPVAQSARVNGFIEALLPGDRPLAAVIHVVLPHSPWRYLPDGRAYAEPAEASDLRSALFTDPWIAAVQRQRHLLQASYTDALVGQILDRLEQQGIYDDAAIAIAADHGVSFQTGQIMRVFTPESTHEIVWAPLLVKAPGQREPAVDDRNVETIDIVPTLADLAGLTVPWPIDGVIASSDEATARGNVKEFLRFTNPIEPAPDSTHEIDAAAGFAEMRADTYPAMRPGDDPVAALYALSGRYDLYGAAYVPTTTDTSAAPRVDDIDRLRSEQAPVLALSGALDDDLTAVTHVVAGLDGRVVGISPIVERKDGNPGFVLLLPAAAPADVDSVRLGLVRGSPVSTQIIDTGSLQG